MVVVHNYSEGKNQLATSSDSSPSDNIDEDRAYVVGIWVVVIFVAIIIVLFVLFAIGRSQERELASSPSKNENEQVAGEKEKIQTETKTEIKEEAPKDVKDLERPLSEDEILAKAKEIPGSQLHIVAVSESLYTIGEKYNLDWREIAEVNNLSPPYNLRVGQKLIIPPKGEGANEN